MAKNSGLPLLYSFDGGNGSAKGISSETGGEIVTFETVMAPMTSKRGLKEEDERPTFSLRIDDTVYVFGVDDVFNHGKRASVRRHNSADRYLTADYFHMLDVLFLHTFANYRGTGQQISPTGIISLPISEYNNEEVRNEVKETFCRKRTLVDYDGCELRININQNRLEIVPESTGALYHWAFGQKNTDTTGTILIVDIGYETTDCSLYENMKYQRDRAMTVKRAGIGNIVRAIQDYSRSVVRDADVSRIDRSMQRLAGKSPKSKKEIEISAGVKVEVGKVYDHEVEQLATKIADEIRTFYTEEVSVCAIGGGGTYHLINALKSHLPFKRTEAIPQAESANILGAYSVLQQMAAQTVKA